MLPTTLDDFYDLVRATAETIRFDERQNTYSFRVSGYELTAVESLLLQEFVHGTIRKHLHDHLYDENSRLKGNVDDVVRAVVSDINRKAAKTRHQRTERTRNFAIERFKSGKFRSTNQAAATLTPDVTKYAAGLGWSMSPSNAQRTVYEWLLAFKKNAPAAGKTQ